MAGAGLFEGIGNAADELRTTGMRLYGIHKQEENTAAAQNVHNREIKLREDIARREEIKFQRQEAERLEQEKKDNAVIPVSAFFPAYKEHPNVMANMEEFLKGSGAQYHKDASGLLFARARDIRAWNEQMKGNIDQQETLAKAAYADLGDKINRLTEQLQNTKKPEEIKAINAEILKAQVRQAMYINTQWGIQAARAKMNQGASRIQPVNRGNKVDIYRDGNFVETKTVGPKPKNIEDKTQKDTEKAEKDRQKAIDRTVKKLREFQKLHYIEGNKAKDVTPERIQFNKEQSAKVEALISQINSGKVDPNTIEWPTDTTSEPGKVKLAAAAEKTPAKKYKTFQEVLDDESLSPEEAARIGREQFGMK